MQTEKSINKALNTAKDIANSATPYRDALVNGISNPNLNPNLNPQTPVQLRHLNQINTRACQLMVEFKPHTHEKFSTDNLLNAKPTTLNIKEAINTWLNSPSSSWDAPPQT